MRHLPPLDGDLAPADVIAALRPVLGEERATRLDGIAAARLRGIACVMEDIHDPHNAGAVLRSCEAMGVQEVHIASVTNRFRTSTRVTQGCERWLDVHRHTSVADTIAAVHNAGYRLYCAVPGAALSVDEIEVQSPGARIALAFGHEHTGLSPQLRDRADGDFSVPMHGASQSLNVSVCAAVSLHTVTESRRRTLGQKSDLSAPEIELLRARFYASDVRGHRLVIARWRSDSGLSAS